MKKCTHCSSSNNDSAVFCKYCGFIFPDASSSIEPIDVSLLHKVEDLQQRLSFTETKAKTVEEDMAVIRSKSTELEKQKNDLESLLSTKDQVISMHSQRAEDLYRQVNHLNDELAKKPTTKGSVHIVYSLLIVAVLVIAFFIGQNAVDNVHYYYMSRYVDAKFHANKEQITLNSGDVAWRSFTYSGESDKRDALKIPNGYGKGEYKNHFFVGNYKDGMPTDGVVFFSTRERYEGTFNSDASYDTGTYVMADGYYFIGTFKHGQPYTGTWYTPDGRYDSRVTNGI